MRRTIVPTNLPAPSLPSWEHQLGSANAILAEVRAATQSVRHHGHLELYLPSSPSSSSSSLSSSSSPLSSGGDGRRSTYSDARATLSTPTLTPTPSTKHNSHEASSYPALPPRLPPSRSQVSSLVSPNTHSLLSPSDPCRVPSWSSSPLPQPTRRSPQALLPRSPDPLWDVSTSGGSGWETSSLSSGSSSNGSGSTAARPTLSRSPGTTKLLPTLPVREFDGILTPRARHAPLPELASDDETLQAQQLAIRLEMELQLEADQELDPPFQLGTRTTTAGVSPSSPSPVVAGQHSSLPATRRASDHQRVGTSPSYSACKKVPPSSLLLQHRTSSAFERGGSSSSPMLDHKGPHSPYLNPTPHSSLPLTPPPTIPLPPVPPDSLPYSPLLHPSSSTDSTTKRHSVPRTGATGNARRRYRRRPTHRRRASFESDVAPATLWQDSDLSAVRSSSVLVTVDRAELVPPFNSTFGSFPPLTPTLSTRQPVGSSSPNPSRRKRHFTPLADEADPTHVQVQPPRESGTRSQGLCASPTAELPNRSTRRDELEREPDSPSQYGSVQSYDSGFGSDEDQRGMERKQEESPADGKPEDGHSSNPQLTAVPLPPMGSIPGAALPLPLPQHESHAGPTPSFLSCSSSPISGGFDGTERTTKPRVDRQLGQPLQVGSEPLSVRGTTLSSLNPSLSDERGANPAPHPSSPPSLGKGEANNMSGTFQGTSFYLPRIFLSYDSNADLEMDCMVQNWPRRSKSVCTTRGC